MEDALQPGQDCIAVRIKQFMEVDIRSVKKQARNLPKRHPARILILAQPDKMPKNEYIHMMVDWFLLLKIPRKNS